MTERVILPEKLGPYEIGEHLESGWGWDVYEAYVQATEDQEARTCHLRVFFNQPKGGNLDAHLTEARNKLQKHPHLHVQRIRDVQHVELATRISAILVEEELLKEWAAPKPSDFRAVMLQLLSAVEHLQKLGLPGIGLSKSNLMRSRTGKAVLASLSPTWEHFWAGRTRAGEAEYYLHLPPESAESPMDFEGAQWVWCAGSLLVEALAGMYPAAHSSLEEDVFDTPISTYVNRVPDDFRESQMAELPEDIQGVLRRALSIHPEDRFATLTKFSEALETPIQTGKVGDRYIMPTSSAVQEVSPPPKNTFFGYALGGAVFVLFMAVVYWFVVVDPSRQEGATLSGSGPGVILEPDTDWENHAKAAERSRTPFGETEDPDPGPVEELDPGTPEFPPKASQDVVVQVPVLTEAPEPVEQEFTLPTAPDQVVGSDASEPVEPIPSEAPPAFSFSEEADGPMGSESFAWKEISGALSKLRWAEMDPQEQEQMLAKVPGWVIRHQSLMADTDTLPSRSFVMDQIKTFWARTPEPFQTLPDVTALLEDIEQRQLTLRIRVINGSEEKVSILDGEGEFLSSMDAGDSTVLDVPSGSDRVVMRAQGESPWMYVDQPFPGTPGGFVSWELTALHSHPVTLVPEVPGPDKEIQMQYSKRDSSENFPLQGEVEVLPGDFKFTFTRPDYYPVTKVLRFRLPGRRYKVNLPSEESWIPKPDMEHLLSWEQRMASEPVQVIEEMKAKHLQALESAGHRDRLVVLQKSVEEQVGAYRVQVDFAGGDQLKPPARVDVTGVDGNAVVNQTGAKLSISPGKYRVVFRRSDYEPIEIDWLVLPLPKVIQLEFPPEPDWEPTPPLLKLKKLEKAMGGSGSRHTVRLIQELRNTSFEWAEHESRYKHLRSEWYRQAVGR